LLKIKIYHKVRKPVLHSCWSIFYYVLIVSVGVSFLEFKICLEKAFEKQIKKKRKEESHPRGIRPEA
jgi:hypothetical protein